MPYAAPVRIKADSISGFSPDDIEDLEKYIKDNILAINSKLQNFRTEKLPEYVRLYKGIPKNKEQDFPWPGAANLVVQLIGTFCDELLSRILGAIYMYDPLFSISLSGDNPDMSGENMKRVLEKFLMDEAYDPASLDFYRVEQAWFNSAIKYGTGVITLPWEYELQREYQYIAGGSTAGDAKTPTPIDYQFNDIVVRDSPHPKLCPLNKFGIDPKIPVMGDAEFFYTIETLNYYQVKNLPGRNDLYKDAKPILEEILNAPDRTSPSELQQEAQQAMGLEGSSDKLGGEWDFYHCYITYKKGSQTYSILAVYHLKSRKLIYAIFNNNPKNLFPVEDVKLSYDDEGYFAAGYAQMLRAYQTELSNNTNWRANNRNFAMLGIFRVDPDSKLSSILQMYPGVMVPAKEGAFEQVKNPVDVGYSSEADQFIMACAKERAGVDPAISGSGGGMVNNKRGIYSASGTSMMLIQQNNRNNLRMSDMRSAHVRAAIKLTTMYSNIGIGTKLKKYGDNAEILKAAFEAYKNETLGFRLRPTTASNNKELERQNDILLQGALSRFNQENAQMLATLANPAQPPPPALVEYFTGALLGNAALFKDILRNFNRDDTSRLIPNITEILKNLQPQKGQENGNGGGFNPEAGSPQGSIPNGGVQSFGGVPGR